MYTTEAEAIAAWNSRAERTCRIEGRYGNQYCTCCGEMVGTWDSTSELYIDGNMVELWNYCPNCGARVMIA
jgi:NAD-dependent SIR2 family protein deacetylase